MRLIQAMKRTILIFAPLHLAIIGLKAFVQQDFNQANMFQILDVDYFYPILGYGMKMYILSYVFIAIFVAFFYVYKPKGTIKKFFEL